MAVALGDLTVAVGAGNGVAERREGREEQRSFEHFVASPRGMLGAILVHASRGATKYTLKMTFPLPALSILIAAGLISYLSLY